MIHYPSVWMYKNRQSLPPLPHLHPLLFLTHLPSSSPTPPLLPHQHPLFFLINTLSSSSPGATSVKQSVADVRRPQPSPWQRGMKSRRTHFEHPKDYDDWIKQPQRHYKSGALTRRNQGERRSWLILATEMQSLFS